MFDFIVCFQSVIGGKEDGLPQLPLPCIHSSATRVYFGHERRLAEGNTPSGHFSVISSQLKSNLKKRRGIGSYDFLLSIPYCCFCIVCT